MTLEKKTLLHLVRRAHSSCAPNSIIMPNTQQLKQEFLDKFCNGQLLTAKKKLYIPPSEGRDYYQWEPVPGQHYGPLISILDLYLFIRYDRPSENLITLCYRVNKQFIWPCRDDLFSLNFYTLWRRCQGLAKLISQFSLVSLVIQPGV